VIYIENRIEKKDVKVFFKSDYLQCSCYVSQQEVLFFEMQLHKEKCSVILRLSS
jgi:hypothetical protein